MIIHMVAVIFHMCMYLCINNFGKNKNAKNEYLSFYRQFDMFSYSIISCLSCDLHLRPQILTIINRNNQPNGHFAYNSF
jgi:hypothetical protein